MRIAAAAIVVLVVLAVLFFLNRSSGGSRLTPGETKVRDLVREVYGGNITSERITHEGADAFLSIDLQNEKLKNMRINLSSLARKQQQEGVTDAALKAALRLD